MVFWILDFGLQMGSWLNAQSKFRNRQS